MDTPKYLKNTILTVAKQSKLMNYIGTAPQLLGNAF